MASKEYRDAVNPLTSKDWFLYYLFNDDEIVTIRNRWRSEVDEVDSGEPGREGLLFLDQEKITESYVKLLINRFGVSADVARSCLGYTELGRNINKNRIPVASIKDDKIVIEIGPDTRLEDVEHLWRIRIDYLQKELPGYTSNRSVQPSRPLLAYVVYRCRLEGRKMVDIHNDYINGTLDERIPAHSNSTLEDFRKYYRSIVQGYINIA